MNTNTTPQSSDDEALVQFLAAPAPRPIPNVIRKGAFREKAPAAVIVFGLVFLGMGLFFAKTFLPWRQLDEWRLAASHPALADGSIVSATATNMSINKTRVMRYDFEFTPSGGTTPVRGICFTTGRRWSAGAGVRVSYDPAEPTLARPVGARLSEGGLVGAFVLFFPVAGAGIIFFSIRARRRTLWLLQNGTLGDFRVTGIERTFADTKHETQYKITLQRIDLADAEPHEVRWDQPKLVTFARERQANGQAIFGLFDPAKPKNVLLPEAWLRRR